METLYRYKGGQKDWLNISRKKRRKIVILFAPLCRCHMKPRLYTFDTSNNNEFSWRIECHAYIVQYMIEGQIFMLVVFAL